MTKAATTEALADELAVLRDERLALDDEISATDGRRRALHKEWATERSRRRTVFARPPGHEPDPAGAEYIAADVAWQAKINAETEAIADANRRRRHLNARIDGARALAREARHGAVAREGAGDVAALADEVEAARRTQRDLATELETVNAAHAAAMAEGDAAALLDLTPRRRDLALRSTAARTASLRAEAAHGRALVAQYADEAQDAGTAVEKAEKALQKAKDALEAATAPVRVAMANRDTWQRRVRQVETNLAQHLAAQQASAA